MAAPIRARRPIPAYFANDRQKAAEAGRKGGQHSHGGHGSAQRAEGKGTAS
ncbi:KGG domain-containing protein [Dankookia sp. P2]|uniref:KGG domain-containing protein n=1 Tax=Dankookia sp. P2 TaxID=3423955 RepID=UPI003D6742EA